MTEENLIINSKILYNELKNYFKNDIKLSLKTEDEIFIVTKNDYFYRIYIPEIELFSGSFVNSNIEKMVFTELCFKKINDIYRSEYQFVAKSDENKVFSWVKDFCGLKVIELNKLLSYSTVISVKCGFAHTLILTKRGEVFAWGDNKFGEIGNGSEVENISFVQFTHSFVQLFLSLYLFCSAILKFVSLLFSFS
jgi:alpha-tubulin suppressor-like RCC1 family protein